MFFFFVWNRRGHRNHASFGFHHLARVGGGGPGCFFRLFGVSSVYCKDAVWEKNKSMSFCGWVGYKSELSRITGITDDVFGDLFGHRKTTSSSTEKHRCLGAKNPQESPPLIQTIFDDCLRRVFRGSNLNGRLIRMSFVPKRLVVVWNIFIFTPTWGRFPFWLIFFKWAGSTTN